MAFWHILLGGILAIAGGATVQLMGMPRHKARRPTHKFEYVGHPKDAVLKCVYCKKGRPH